jgi:hypothetical protein
MGFASSTRNQLSMLIYPRNGNGGATRKHLYSMDDTNSTVSTVGDDDSLQDNPMPLLCHGEISIEKGTSAYNFERYDETTHTPKPSPPLSFLRTPLPCIMEPSYVKLAALSMPASPQASNGSSNAGSASYRWNMDSLLNNNTNDMEETVLPEVFKPFFTFATRPADEDEENMDYSASTSLLGGGCGASGKSAFAKPSSSSSFSTSAASCFTPRISFRRKNESDESVHLMHEATALSNDWSERQLAFDLEVVEDDPTLDDNGPLSWTMSSHPLPQPITIIKDSQIAIGNSLYLLPKALLPVPGTPRSPELQIQQAMYDGLIRGSRKSPTPVASKKNASSRPVHRRSHSSHGCLGSLHGTPTSAQHPMPQLQPLRVHHHSSKSRKSSSSRRRGSPVLRGRQFAPNLSTVPERPSEEDTATSYSLTPRNNSNTTTPTSVAGTPTMNN